MIGWARFREQRQLRALAKIFRASESLQRNGPSIRVTDHGIWVPTPVAVLVGLLRSLKARRFFEATGRRNLLLDVGAGDGRVLALLAFFEPELEVIGVESDERLYRQAETNLEILTRMRLVVRPERARLLQSDYRELDEATHGLHLKDVNFVFNYPDGNERAIERFVIEKAAPDANLCFLTHDPELRAHELALTHEESVAAPDTPAGWRFSVYSTPDP